MKNTQDNQRRPLSLRSINGQSASLMALGMSTALLSSGVLAEEKIPETDNKKMQEVVVEAEGLLEPGAPYKAKKSGDSRHTKPLAETPQNISVMTEAQIKDSGRSDLRAILEAQPGITLGTGENGNAFGDRYIIRGQEARSDVFVDGLRDPGMTIRESFAVEQVEVTKGPSSTFAGRGSTGGAVNSITKKARVGQEFSKAELGVGTDANRRVTLDSNNKISEDAAVRLNLLYGERDVPDRSPADQERQGMALSGAFQATDKLNLAADYYYVEANDRPDLGTYINGAGGRPVDDIPVYLQEGDFLESKINVFTLRQAYEVNGALRLENAMRYGTTENGYVATGARGATRDATDPTAPGAPTMTLSTHQGWQDVEYFVDQFNTYFDTELASMEHQFVLGAEYSEMNVINGVYKVTNTGATNCLTPGRSGVSNSYCILDGDGNAVANINNLMGRVIEKGDYDSDYDVDTLSLYAMDTIDLTDTLHLFLGLRLDRFDYGNTVVSGGGTTITKYRYSDTLWNGHVGMVYDVTDEGNVYLSRSTSYEINGGESDVGGSCGYGGLCGDPQQVKDSKPEKSENYEVGTKWNILDEKLLLTAALFQITKDDVMESVGSSYSDLGTLNTGKNRVKGWELSAAGNITEKLSTQAGLTRMDSEVLEAFNETQEGKVLSNFADDSLYLQLRYEATDKFAFGAVATYSSEMYTGQPDTAAGFNAETGEYNYEVPSYSVYDVFASYEFSDDLELRANIDNVTDKDYYLAGYRSGSFTYIGDARSTTLTLAYSF